MMTKIKKYALVQFFRSCFFVSNMCVSVFSSTTNYKHRMFRSLSSYVQSSLVLRLVTIVRNRHYATHALMFCVHTSMYIFCHLILVIYNVAEFTTYYLQTYTNKNIHTWQELTIDSRAHQYVILFHCDFMLIKIYVPFTVLYNYTIVYMLSFKIILFGWYKSGDVAHHQHIHPPWHAAMRAVCFSVVV